MNSLLLSNETQTFKFNVRFTYDPVTPFYLVSLDKNGLSPSLKAKADILRKKDVLNYVIANFSRPVSMEILLPVKPHDLNYLQRVDRLATVLLIPGSIRQLEEVEGLKLNESTKELKSTQTACFWFHKFKVNESKINEILEYAKASAENLHCISLPNEDSGLKLSFDYKGIRRSIQIFPNLKTIATFELVMMLKNVQSMENVTRYVQEELKNPTAKLTKRHQEKIVPCVPYHPWFYERYLFGRNATECKPNDREETMVFESDSPFSNETEWFAYDACDGWEEKNGLFGVLRLRRYRGIAMMLPLQWYDSLEDRGWSVTDPVCSVGIKIKMQRLSVVGELSLSDK